MADPFYSIVIPAYNESERLRETLDSVVACVAEKKWDVEVIVVNDGSRDNTRDIILEYAVKHACVRLLDNPGNRGKGYSVRHGMLEARGELLLFSDADLASPIEEAERLFAVMRGGVEVAVGSRWLDPSLQTVRQPFYRRVLGRIYNLLLRVLLGLNYKDTQCGFKAFTRAAAQAVFPRQIIERWGFDPEILYLARHLGLKIEEVAVHWAHRENTKIHPFRDGVRMFGELLRIRWYAVSGRYKG